MFALISRAFYGVFRSAILEAYTAARESAFAEIKASLPTDADLAEARSELATASRPALAAPKRKPKD